MFINSERYWICKMYLFIDYETQENGSLKNKFQSV